MDHLFHLIRVGLALLLCVRHEEFQVPTPPSLSLDVAQEDGAAQPCGGTLEHSSRPHLYSSTHQSSAHLSLALWRQLIAKTVPLGAEKITLAHPAHGVS